MNIRFLNLVILLFITTISFAQSLELPDFAVASPEAASLGQFGDVPINLAIGQINYTIPLYTIKVGDFEYPLTLSYGYLGFKPDSDPTMVGMGWTANFGGAIVRQSKGIPDDHTVGYEANGFYIDKIKNLNTLPETEKVEWLKKIVDEGLDLRPDVYIINTPTLSGSFRKKLDKSCVFTEQRNYNITAGSNFDLVDDKGVRYNFATKEISTTNPPLGVFDDDVTTTSSWLISQIEIPNAKGKLSFSYKKDPVIFSTEYGTEYLHKRSDKGDFDTKFSASATGVISQIIERIDFPGGYVVFGTNTEKITVSGSAIGWNYNYPTNKVKLQNMSVFNSNDKLIAKYVFDYYDQGYYYFLKSIIKEDEQGKQEDYYSFEYYDLNRVPNNKVTSDKVDMDGFFNNKAFNKNDIPSSLNGSFTYSRIGALKKITYPTKGATEIEYEGHGINHYRSYYKCLTVQTNISETLIDRLTDENHPDYSAVTKKLEIPFNQTVTIELKIFSSYSGSSEYCGLTNSSGSFVGNPEVILSAITDRVVEKTFTVSLSAGTYYLYSILENAVDDSYSEVTVHYSNKPTINGVHQGFTTNIGGIRIAKTIDDPGNGQELITRNYIYSGAGSHSFLRFKSLEIERSFEYYNFIKLGLDGSVIALSQTEDCQSTLDYTDYTENFKPILPLSSVGSHVQYGHVEIISSDGTNGKTIKEFSNVVKTSVPSNPIFPDLVSDFENGKFELTEEGIYPDGNGALIQGEEYTYQEQIDNNNYIEDYQIMRYPKVEAYITCDVRKRIEVIHVSKVSSFQIGRIEHHTRAYRIDYTDATRNGLNKIFTDYTYDPQTGYPTEVSTTNSDGKATINKTYYPNNTDQLSGLDQSVINTMKTQNMLAIPIQTEKLVYEAQNLLSKTTQRTVFKDWGSNPDNTDKIVLPEYIQTSTGSNALENRIQYHSYYSNGNFKEVSKFDGTSVYYIWGYNNKYPIAKIENFTTAQANSIASLINTAIAASNNDNSRTFGSTGTEGALRTALNNIRIHANLQNAMVTTYTYDPLIGITSVTDPNAYTIYYDYDEFNRLKSVKDSDGNLLKENKYNFKD